MCEIDNYMTMYREIVLNYTPGNNGPIRRLRRLIAEHKRTCPECRDVYLALDALFGHIPDG